MENELDRKFVFSVSELIVLLAIAGCNYLVGLYDPVAANIDINQVVQIIFRLHQKGIVSQKDEKIELKEEYRKIVDGLMNAKKMFVFSVNDESYPEYSLYIGETCIEAYNLDENGKKIVLSEVNPYRVLGNIGEKGFRIDSHVEDDFDEERKEVQGLPSDKWDLEYTDDKEELFQKKGIFGVASLWNVKRIQEYAKLVILTDELEDFIVLLKDKEKKMYQYSAKGMGKILVELLEEEI